jgi:CMP-N,N'-diacetyllegionaminic acid synthase
MKILGLIPARGGSKGIPKKNVKILGEIPLIEHTIRDAQKATLLTKIVVSTDDPEIALAAENAGCKTPFVRPATLAQDTSTSLEVVQHALNFFKEQGELFDAVCLLQPTNPYREKGFIDAAIEKFISSKADSLVSVLPVPHEFNPHWVFEKDEMGMLKIATGEDTIISRRQDLPNTFHRDGAIYITKVEVVNAGSLYGKNIASIESNPDYYINIDTQKDWEKAEYFLINKER